MALSFLMLSFQGIEKNGNVDEHEYLREIKVELTEQWPENRTINLVFHGHSVPSGYFKTPVVNTFGSYPYQLLSKLKQQYPFAVVNVINTSIGGENSVSGEQRFKSDVLIYKPDVLFIDYILNDRSIGLEKSKAAWESMIRRALHRNIKVILLTPSPDLSVNILDSTNVLEQHAIQIKGMAAKFGIGLADSYGRFKQLAAAGVDLKNYMSQENHPNEKGHELIATEIFKYFK